MLGIHTTNVHLTLRFVCLINLHIIILTFVILQACEQLNAWVGGFQPVLNQMTVDNFNWFLHYLLFLHTQRVIRKQKEKARTGEEVNEEDEEIEDEGIDIEDEE